MAKSSVVQGTTVCLGGRAVLPTDHLADHLAVHLAVSEEKGPAMKAVHLEVHLEM